MLFFWFNLIFSKELFASYSGDDNICSISIPCSYKTVESKLENGDLLFIFDKYIAESHEIYDLRRLFNFALSKNVLICSENATINGSLYESKDLSFLMLQSGTDSRIHCFHFTCFRSTIICFRKVERGVISLCTFSSNRVLGGIGMLVFGLGRCKIEDSSFVENIIVNTSLLVMSSAYFYLENIIIERNFVNHESRQALLYSINSVCEYTNTTIRNNHSPSAPLHQLEFRSCFGFWNCKWENNHHHEIILCDGICEFNFSNNFIFGNHGSFLTVTDKALVTFNDTNFINNFSGDRAMFDIFGGTFVVQGNAIFEDNCAYVFVDLHGNSSIISIEHAEFIRNMVDVSIFLADVNSSVSISNTTFIDNSSKQGLINVKDSNFMITKSLFSGNKGVCLKLEGSISTFAHVKFFHNNIHSIHSVNGSTQVYNCFFKGKNLYGHLKIPLDSKLSHLTFDSGENYSLSRELISICKDCTYNYSDKYAFIMWILVFCVLFAAIYIIFMNKNEIAVIRRWSRLIKDI